MKLTLVILSLGLLCALVHCNSSSDEIELVTEYGLVPLTEGGDDTAVTTFDDVEYSASCSCSNNKCHCCLSHQYKVNAIFKKYKFDLNACVDVAYRNGFFLKFVLNGRTMYDTELSLRNPPSLCYGVPGLKKFAKLCLKFYNIDISKKSMCIKLYGKLDLKVKTFGVDMKFGCFKIPSMIEDNMLLEGLYEDNIMLDTEAGY